MKGFFDASCPRCSWEFGWRGTISDRPPCPHCGHSFDRSALAAQNVKLEALSEELRRNSEREDSETWEAGDARLRSIYADGWSAASSLGSPEAALRVSPLDRENPYGATRSPDRQFHQEEYTWWNFGWSDYTRGICRSQKEFAMAFTAPTDAQLSHRFLHHSPKGDQADRYGKIRAEVLAVAKVFRDLTPVSPEQSRALNALDEAMFLANAAIARNEQ